MSMPPPPGPSGPEPVEPPAGGGQPQQPGQYGQPQQPGQYGQPQQPGQYGQPQQSGQYGQPQQPGQYGQPQQPGQYGQPQQPGQYGQPQQSGQYGQPQQPGQYGPGPDSAQYGMAAQYQNPERKSRKGLWIGGGVVGVLALAGAGAWGATWFLGTGAQPAEALPGDTVAYVAVDMDPSGAQKIEAIKTLRKFPAIKENLDVGEKDDLRPKLFDSVVPKDCGMDYDKDMKPWLGERFALAAVDFGDDMPTPVGVVQISDANAAKDSIKKLVKCAEGPSDLPIATSGDWLVVSDTEANAKKVVEETKKGSLASDADYKKWTEAAGGEGILTAYAAPEAGKLMADNAQDVVDGAGSRFGMAGVSAAAPQVAAPAVGTAGSSARPTIVPVDDPTMPPAPTSTEMPDLDELTKELERLEKEMASDFPSGLPSDDATGLPSDDPSDDFGTDGFGTDEPSDDPFSEDDTFGEDDFSSPSNEVPTEVLDALRDFKGGAAALRFNDGSVEFELAGGAKEFEGVSEAPGTADDLTTKLPSDTAAVISMAFPDNMVEELMKKIGEVSGGEMTEQDLKDGAKELGLELPDDADKALGKGMAIVLGGGFTAQDFESMESPDDVPMGVIVDTPAKDLQSVIDKLKANAPEGDLAEIEDYTTVEGDDRSYWAPNSTYLAELQKDGGLGGEDTYQNVITDDDAAYLAYVNIDQIIKAFDSELSEQDPEVKKNLEPLEAFGVTGSSEKGEAHFKVKLTTD